MNRRGFLKLLGLAPIAAVGSALIRAGSRAAVAAEPAEEFSKATVDKFRLAYQKASDGAPAPDWVYYAGDRGELTARMWYGARMAGPKDRLADYW